MGTTLEAGTLREAMARFLEALRAHREEIDSLNVFPVPDGDTGTNLLLTQQAVQEALERGDGDSLAEVGERISRAALMGARGNSGVILSQILRGLCDGLAGNPDLGAALARGSDEAHGAVAHPVEGTMLSVVRDAARAARRSEEEGTDAGAVAEAALEEARASLERTREQLPELRQAGVVDAGGKGVVLLLDAVVSALRDRPLSTEVGPMGPVARGTADAAEGGGTRYGYEVMYLLECGDQAVPPLRRRLGDLGDSLVVVGGGGLYNVHVHTDEPGPAVEAGIDAGRPRGIRITSLDEQVQACLADEARAVRGRGEAGGGASALVAVAPGKGAARLFRSLGASVVAGGPGRNPSVAELARAVEEAPAAAVLLLPNHRNVLPAAERAAEAAGREARVLPTRSVPEGIVAATAFDAGAALEANEERAREALQGVVSLEVAQAVRDADTPAGRVGKGDHLAVVAGEVRAVGRDPVGVALEALRPLVRPEHEILTLLLGEGVADEEGERARRAVVEAFGELEVEVHRGDQPGYPFLVGLE